MRAPDDRSIDLLAALVALFVGTLTETIHQATLAAARASFDSMRKHTSANSRAKSQEYVADSVDDLFLAQNHLCLFKPVFLLVVRLCWVWATVRRA